MNQFFYGQQAGGTARGQAGASHTQPQQPDLGPQAPSYLPALMQEPKPKLRWVRVIVCAVVLIPVCILFGTVMCKVVATMWEALGEPPAALFPGDSFRVFSWIVSLGVLTIVAGLLLRKVLR